MKQSLNLCNIKNWPKISFLFMILSLSSWSCTEKINIELDNTYTRLVVWGELTTDTTVHTVRLTRTADYFFNQPTLGVSDAQVTINDGENTITLTENAQIKGTYETPPDYFGVPGKIYTLDISGVDVDGDGIPENHSASSKLRSVNPVDSIHLEIIEIMEALVVNVFAWDSPEKDWYLFKVYLNNVLVSDTLTEWFAQTDDLFNGNYTNGITSQILYSDYENERPEVGDTVTFEINGITEEFYNFVIGMQQEIMFSAPLFSGPPANVTTNLTNDALGFFAVYSAERASTIVTEVPNVKPGK